MMTLADLARAEGLAAPPPPKPQKHHRPHGGGIEFIDLSPPAYYIEAPRELTDDELVRLARARGILPPLGLGAVGRVPTDGEKAWATQQAEDLAAQSLNADPDTTLASVAQALGSLGGYVAWTDTSRGWLSARYSDSQTVRSNLQVAQHNALSQKGQGGSIVLDTRPMRPVSVADETLKNLPGEIKARGEELLTTGASTLETIAIGAAVAVTVGGTAYLVSRLWPGRRT